MSKRHQEYINALKYHGVDVFEGHFIFEDVDCRGCKRVWEKPSEKESDVNLAIELISDGHMDVYDHAYLVTADSDQGATARMFKGKFANKRLYTAIPPGQAFSKSILTYTPYKIEIKREHIEDCLLAPIMIDSQGLRYKMPKDYAPPAGFVPPSEYRSAKRKA